MSIVGKKIGVLDDGFVRVVDTMGDDSSVVQAARISYGKGTKKTSGDRGLIRYLMRRRHTTPFEMCEIKLHVRVPMDCWRQWIRHRTANVNEYSTRYSEAIDAFQKTGEKEWRVQANTNRQGSGGDVEEMIGQMLSNGEAEFHENARKVYRDRLEKGIAREQARKDLPLSTYTEAYWKIDLHNLFHFLELRMDVHAQYEIRQYAIAIGEHFVADWCPISWEAFLDYRLNSISLTRLDQEVIQSILGRTKKYTLGLVQELGWLDNELQPRRNRERSEFEIKARRLGIPLPWDTN